MGSDITAAPASGGERALGMIRASAVVAVLYSAAGALGLWLLHRILAPDMATLAPTLGVPWLAVGIGVAGVLRFGTRALPGALIGSCITWGVVQGDPWQPVLIDGLGETASIWLIVSLLRNWGYRPSLERYQDVLILVAAAALGRLLSAGVDVIATFATAWIMTTPETRAVLEEAGVYRSGNVFVVNPTLFTSTFRWWANSVGGVVLVVPLLAATWRGEQRAQPGPRLELALWGLATFGWLAAALALPGLVSRILVLALALVLVVWAALRFGVAIAAAGTLVFAAAATVGFGLQLGAFAGIGGREGVEVVWGFIGLLAGAGLFLTPLLAGRDRAQRNLATSVERYRRLFVANPTPMWAEEPASGRIRIVNDAALRAYGYSEAQFLALRSADLLAQGSTPPGNGAPFTGTPGPFEAVHRRASGGELAVEVTPVEVVLDGTPLRVCFIEPVRERDELRLAVLSAADLERHRLGQEIRDGLGRVLGALTRRIEELAVAASCNEPISVELAQATEAEAVTASGLCRQLTRGASPIQFASGNLLEALRRLPEILVADGGADVSVSIRSLAPLRLSVERAEHVYRIVQDAVRAALVRPGTVRVYVAIDVTAEKIDVTIEEDRGPERAPAPAPLDSWPAGVRVAAARAHLDVGSLPGGGTRVHLECAQSLQPLPPAGSTHGAEPPDSGAARAHAAPGETAPRSTHATLRAWLDGAAWLLLYVAAGAAGLRFLKEVNSQHIALFPAVAIPWIASGISVGGILLRGKRLAPAIFLGTIVIWRGLAAEPWISVLADACGETGGALLIVHLLGRWGFRRGFDRFRDFAVLVVAAAAGGLVHTAVDAFGLHFAHAFAPSTLTPELLAGLAPAGEKILGLTHLEVRGYLRWWLNGLAGVTLGVPVIVTISAGLGRTLRRRWGEAAVFALALGMAALAIGGGPPANWRLPLLGLGVVMVAWAAVRFDVALAAAAALALSLAATYGYGFGLGPFATATPGEGPEVLWGFIGLLGATGLFLTTVVAEHEVTMRGLKGVRSRYQTLFEAIPRPLFAFAEPDGRITMVNEAAIRKYGYSRTEFLALNSTAINSGPAAADLSPGVEATVAPRMHRSRDGEEFEVELSLTRVELGEEFEQLCFAIDVTELNALRRRVLETSDLERRRLAQELHDSLGQSLTGLHLGLASVRRTVEQSGTAKLDAVLFVSGAIRDATQVCEQIVLGLSPLHATDGDLVAALKRLPAHVPPGVSESLAIDVRTTAPLRLPLPMREHVYQIAREAVNNAVKHAQASRIAVTLAVDPELISMTIEDNGIGFNPTEQSGTGFGLQSLGLRAMALRGRLQVLPRAGGGTTVSCRCPQSAS